MIEIGDRVAVLDDAISGRVAAISGSLITIEDQDGFEITFDRSELVKIEPGNIFFQTPDNIDEIVKEKDSFKKQRPKISTRNKKEIPPMEVDLHIEKLTKKYKRLSNYEILTMQLDTAKGQLQFAFSKRIQRIIFIHGVGQGVLKAELEYLFRQYDHIRVLEADYRRYGHGAMEVYILQRGLQEG